MAPRRRRPKVGLTRMHAALDAMRPMGFSTDVVRKCVKTLLKVYGEDGWAFIEEAAYKMLIDTILEEPVVEQLEHEHRHLQLGSGSHGSDEKSESVPEPSSEEVIVEGKLCRSHLPEPDTHCEDFRIKEDITRPEVGIQLGFAMPYTPQSSESNPKNRACKPCYGWISDDEEDDFLQLTPTC
ncbi:hypothetical protein OROHE_014105 [Orobanche hederae]